MTSKPKVTVAVLSGYERTYWVHPAIVELLDFFHRQQMSGACPVDFRYTPVHGNGTAAYKRNLIGKAFKEGSADSWGDWLCMIDSDMTPKADIWRCITEAPEDASVVVPRMWMWDEARGTATLCWGISSNPDPGLFMRILNNRQGYTRLTKSGTGAIFIHRRVFERIEEPYFWRHVDPATGQEKDTEDVTFTLKVKAAGLKIYGCNAVEVGHYHNVNISTVAARLYTDRVLTAGLNDGLDNGDKLEASAVEERPSDAAVATV